jgi:hypothetical protein
MPNKNYQRNTDTHRTNQSIDALNTNVTQLANVIMQLTDKVSDNTKVTDKATKIRKKTPEEQKADRVADKVQKTRENSELKRAKGIDKLFDSLPSGIGKLFGPKTQEKITKSIVSATMGGDKARYKQYQELRQQGVGAAKASKAAGIDPKMIKQMGQANGKQLAGALGNKGGMLSALSQGMGGIAGMAGSLLSAAGPIGAGLTAAKMVFDFWDEGGFAKINASMKMMGGDISGGVGSSGFEQMKHGLEGTAAHRKILAKYNYEVPVELHNQALKDELDFEKQTAMDALQYKQGLLKDEVSYEIGLRKDAMQFGFQQAMQTLEARQEKEKALYIAGMEYIKGFNSISERALRAIGTSTKEIISTMGMVQIIFSATNEQSRQIATNNAILAQTLGGSAEEANNISNLFRLMNKTTGVIGSNLIGGFEAMAKANGVTKASVFKQIAGAAAEIYKFSAGTADSLVKQAISLTKMGVQMSSIAKASETMVLNYKDSIKSEMELSAMMGRNVDLSEARARLMSGDMEGGAQAIKSALGDMDIASMNAFQKQALSQATGMDISAIMGLMQGGEGGANGKLTENENIGRMIAQGALKEEIHHAGEKLGLEQAQRKKMLEFEQKERLVMLAMEQQNRLQNLAIEQKYRIKYANLQKEEDIDNMVAQMQASVAEGFTTNLISGAAGEREVDGSGAYSKNANLSKEMGELLTKQSTDLHTLIKSGMVSGTDPRMAKIYTAMMDSNLSGDTKGLAEAFTKSFGPEMEKYTNLVAKTNAENQKKADALQKFVTAYNTAHGSHSTISDVTAGGDATKEIKKLYPELLKNFTNANQMDALGDYSGAEYDPKKAQSMIDALRKPVGGVSVIGSPEAAGGVPQIAPPDPEAEKVALLAANEPTIEVLATQTAEQKANSLKELKASAKEHDLTMADSKVRLKADSDAATTMYTQLNELLAMTGLSLEFLNDIATSNRIATDVKLDGARVGSLLNEVTRKQFGVVKVTS